jgi:hypothetical protein
MTPVMRQPQMMQAKRPPERHLKAILHQSIKRQPGHHSAVFFAKNQLIPVIINLNMGWILFSVPQYDVD